MLRVAVDVHSPVDVHAFTHAHQGLVVVHFLALMLFGQVHFLVYIRFTVGVL